MSSVVDSSLATIGNTPIVQLRRIVPDSPAQVIVKFEAGKPSESYKDRIALAIIEATERRGVLKPGQRVAESSGGNTGTSPSYVCESKGYPCTIISEDTSSQE